MNGGIHRQVSKLFLLDSRDPQTERERFGNIETINIFFFSFFLRLRGFSFDGGIRARISSFDGAMKRKRPFVIYNCTIDSLDPSLLNIVSATRLTTIWKPSIAIM